MNDPLMNIACGRRSNRRPNVPVEFERVDTGYVAQNDLAWNPQTRKWETIPLTKVVVGHPVKDFHAVARRKLPKTFINDLIGDIATYINGIEKKMGEISAKSSFYGKDDDSPVVLSISLSPMESRDFFRYDLLKISEVFDSVEALFFFNKCIHSNEYGTMPYVRLMGLKNSVIVMLDMHTNKIKN